MNIYTSLHFFEFKKFHSGFPGGSVVKNLPVNAGDMGSVPDLGRSHMPRSYKACGSQLTKPGGHKC